MPGEQKHVNLKFFTGFTFSVNKPIDTCQYIHLNDMQGLLTWT